MSRSEKRRMDRCEAWFNSLSEDKKQIIYGIINERINSNNDMMNAISDICTINALDDVLNVSIPEVRNIIVKTKEYMVDYGEYLEKEKDGGIKMIENVELKEKIKIITREYIKGGVDKAKGLKLLRKEFNLPNAELSDIWIECKSYNEGYSKSKNLPDKEQELDVNMEFKDVELSDVGIKMESKPEKKIYLKVVKVTQEIEGEYGTYIKSDDGVTIDGKLYIDVDDVKKEKTVLMSEYNNKMDIIKDKIKALNMELTRTQDLGVEEIEKFTELESVFGL